MKTLVNALSRAASNRPVVTLATSILVTLILGVFASQAVITDGNDGFAPDAEELLAVERISDLFGDDTSASVLQVIISAEDGDVLDTDGLATVTAVREALAASPLGALVLERPDQPGVVSFLIPLEQAIAQGAPVPTSDAEFKAGYIDAFGQLPPDFAGITSSLLSGDRDLESATARKGLMLVFLDAPSFDAAAIDEFDPSVDFEDFMDVESEFAETVRGLDLPAGYSAEPFSIELIFATGDEFQQEIGRLFGMAFMIIVLILLFVFWVKPRGIPWWKSLRRSAADMALTMVTIVQAIFWMNGVGVILGPKYLGLIDDFGPMTQIIPILLIGLGVDYSIHLTSRYRDETGGGAEVTAAMRAAIHTVGVALVLATVTTAVGFLTNLVSPIPALKDFGILAAVGIGASFLLMLTFVASARILLDRRAEAGDRLPREALGATSERALPTLIGKTSWLARKAAVPTLVVALALGGVGVYGVTQLDTTFSFTDFVPRPNPLLETFDSLVEDFGGGFGESAQVLIEGDDLATPETHNAMVAAYGNLTTTENVVQFGDFPAANSVLSLIDSYANPQSPTFDPGVGLAAQAAGMQPGSPAVSPDADVAALYDALYAAAPEDAARFLHRDSSGEYDAALVDITTTAGESGASQLSDDLKAAFQPVVDAGPSIVATSDEIINAVVIDALSSSQLGSLLITILAAMALLVLNFWVESRRPLLGVITILPVALVVLWTFGMMALTGIPFGPVTATVSALAIGIGVPYTIHITHRFQEDRVRYASGEEAIHETATHTGGALAGSAFTTIAGFGILVTASLIPFQQFGMVTVYAIAFALIAAILVLPSMLVLWDRYHRNRGHVAVDAEALQAALEE